LERQSGTNGCLVFMVVITLSLTAGLLVVFIQSETLLETVRFFFRKGIASSHLKCLMYLVSILG